MVYSINFVHAMATLLCIEMYGNVCNEQIKLHDHDMTIKR